MIPHLRWDRSTRSTRSPGRQEAWKNILPRDRGGILLLGAFRVTPDGQALAYSWSRALSNLYIADGLI